jgi:hypothetical protein
VLGEKSLFLWGVLLINVDAWKSMERIDGDRLLGGAHRVEGELSLSIQCSFANGRLSPSPLPLLAPNITPLDGECSLSKIPFWPQKLL